MSKHPLECIWTCCCLAGFGVNTWCLQCLLGIWPYGWIIVCLLPTLLGWWTNDLCIIWAISQASFGSNPQEQRFVCGDPRHLLTQMLKNKVFLGLCVISSVLVTLSIFWLKSSRTKGIEMYGLANWNEVAEHVGTNSKSNCIEHYNTTYMSSPCFPLPDMSHVMGKNREELLAMARGHGEVTKGYLCMVFN